MGCSSSSFSGVRETYTPAPTQPPEEAREEAHQARTDAKPEPKEEASVRFEEPAVLNRDDPSAAQNATAPLLKSEDVEKAEPDEAPEKEEKPMPWGRFAGLWICCSLAAGVLPGQSLFAEMFANAGVYSSSCEDGKPGCTDQFLVLTSIFGVGQSIAYGFSAPIGLLYDRWGAMITGTVGALICAIGMLLVSGSVMGAAAGYDSTTSYLFLVGTLTCDFGSLLNSFSFMGLIWHFPGKQTRVIALINATYQASAMLPILIEAGMRNYGLSLSSIMLGWTVVTFITVYFCWVLIPTQAEYYEQAKKVLGMPLPKPPTEMRVKEMLWRAVEVLQQNQKEHLVSACALATGLAMPGFYSSLAAPYGEALFGHKADGEKLAQINVTCTTIVGLAFGPFVGTFADAFGLEALIVIFGFLMAVAAGSMPFANWPLQVVCAVALVLYMALWAIFISRYLLLYSPPNRIGATQGVYSLGVVMIGLPWQMLGIGATSVLPKGPDAYRIPMWVFAAMGIMAMSLYACFYRKNPPPEVPPLLPEDEAELAKGFGCGNLDEVCEVTNTKTKGELVRKLASSNPEDMQSLIKSIDTQKMMEMMARRPVEDIADMMEENDGGDEEPEEEEETSAPAAAEEAPPASVSAAPAEAAGESPIRTRSRYLAEKVNAGDKEAVRHYLLNEPVEDMWNIQLDLEEWQTKAEQKALDKGFNKLIPGKEFAAILRERPELKTFVQRMIKREMEKKIASFTGRKKK